MEKQKKIRFPLTLAGGVQVRKLEELKEHFDLDSVLAYYKNGKLLTWLRDRYYESEADAVEALDETAPDFQQKLCGIFGAEYTGEADLKEIQRRQERLSRLRSITGEPEYLEHIDQVAFDQEELADLLDAGAEKIYLCGGKFTVPASVENVQYIGIERPQIHISGKITAPADKLAEQFVGCDADNLPAHGENNTGPELSNDFSEFSAIGEVRGVHLGEGSDGFRTIQVDLEEPVFLDGVEYDHVPVLSAGLFEELKLNRGSKIKVHRVGDVIPSITVVKKGDGPEIKLPKKCSGCGRVLQIKNKKLYCDNPMCNHNVIGRLTAFLEKLGVDGYSESFVRMLYDKMGVGDISTLLSFTDEERFKEEKLDTKTNLAFQGILKKAIANTPDYVILGAMGIPDVGPAKALLILKYVGGFDRLILRANSGRGVPANGDIMGIRTAVSRAVPATQEWAINGMITDIWFQNDLVAVRKCMSDDNITTKFDMARVGHTGFTPDRELRNLCKKNDFQLVDGKAFDMLIVPNKTHVSAKTERAEKDSIPVYTLGEFRYRFDANCDERPEDDDDDDG